MLQNCFDLISDNVQPFAQIINVGRVDTVRLIGAPDVLIKIVGTGVKEPRQLANIAHIQMKDISVKRHFPQICRIAAFSCGVTKK